LRRLLLLLLFFGCSPSKTPPSATESHAKDAGASLPTTAQAPEKIQYDDSALELFQEHKVTGSFVLYKESTGETTIVGKEDAYVRWQPCSTFKIPNTLIGLETAVIPDARFSLKWDGKKRDVEEWNHDHTLESAMRYSVVWFYQEVARRIGAERMKSWVSKLEYGNKKVEGAIDGFWLDDGSLRISTPEQVSFLRRLRAGELAARGENVAIVQKVVPNERFGPTVVSSKTGLCKDKDQSIGWYVGWAEARTRYVFALHIRAGGSELERIIPLRRELTLALLKRFHVL